MSKPVTNTSVGWNVLRKSFSASFWHRQSNLKLRMSKAQKRTMYPVRLHPGLIEHQQDVVFARTSSSLRPTKTLPSHRTKQEYGDPTKLTGNTPVLNVVHPCHIHIGVLLWDKLDATILNRFNCRFKAMVQFSHTIGRSIMVQRSHLNGHRVVLSSHTDWI